MRDPKELNFYPHLNSNDQELVDLICAAYPRFKKIKLDWVSVRQTINMVAQLQDVAGLYRELGWLKITCAGSLNEEKANLIITTISEPDSIYAAENRRAVRYLNQIISQPGWEVSSWNVPDIILSPRSSRYEPYNTLYLLEILIGSLDSKALYDLVLRLDVDELDTFCISLTTSIETKIGGSLKALQLILQNYEK